MHWFFQNPEAFLSHFSISALKFLAKLYKDGLKICMWFFQNPETVFNFSNTTGGAGTLSP